MAGPEVAPGAEVRLEVQDLGSDRAADVSSLGGTRLSDAEGQLSDAEEGGSFGSVVRPGSTGGFLVEGF